MIPICEPLIGEDELDNVVEAVKSGWVSSGGKFVKEFEDFFAEWVGKKYGVATSSGTTALHLALAALNVGPEDEIIVPTLTFIATANVVRYCRATPVFVDAHLDYWCMDPASISGAITKRTKGIIPVHLYGHPCNMDAILGIASKHNLWVVEDCAEAHGAKYKGNLVGSFGDISCFSFFGNKIMTTGEGGMCLTDDGKLAEKMRNLRDHGMDPTRKYWHNVIGFNYRMTNLQAALGVAQLEKVDYLIARRNQVAEWYDEILEAETLDVGFVIVGSWAAPVCWIYTILVDEDVRDRLMGELKDKGIETRPMFYPVHIMPPYEQDKRFPVAEDLSACGISLPSGPTLTKKDVEYICSCIKEILG